MTVRKRSETDRGPHPVVLGAFRVEAVVGRGSFGRVLRVVDTRSAELRALKLVTAGSEAMLLDEYAQLARLAHPSLPRVFDVGRTYEPIATADTEVIPIGTPFFVAEWIPGGRSDDRPWAADDNLGARLWALIADIAGALATIHAVGLVHGDVAPQNLMFGDADRAVLVDLGLATASGVRGTPAFMAPEAFAGLVEPRSDLYSLAATLIRLVDGQPPYTGATLGELVHRIVRGDARPVLAGVPRPLADLIVRMLARDVDGRPASALAVLAELDQLAPVVSPRSSVRRARPDLSPPTPASWPEAPAAIDAIAAALETATVIAVPGEAGSGSRALVDAAIRRHQLARVARGANAVAVCAGTLDEVAANVAGGGAMPSEPRHWVTQVARSARGFAGIVVFELADDPRGLALLAALARTPGRSPTVVLVDDLGGLDPAREITAVPAPLLDPDGVATLAESMLGRRPPPAWSEALHAICAGLPLTAIELIRAISDAPDPLAIDWRARSSVAATQLRAVELAAVSADLRRLVLAIAVWGGRVRIDRALATARGVGYVTSVGLGEVTELVQLGLVRRTGGDVLVDRATLEAALASAGDDGRAAMADHGIAIRGDAAPELVAALLEHATIADSAALACEIAEALIPRGRADRALAVARRVVAVAPARAGLVAAQAAAATGAYPEAEAYARQAERAGADRVSASLAIARVAQRAGDLDVAETALAALYADVPARDDVAGAYARLLVTRSRFTEARGIALAGGGALAGLRAEAAGLAAFYLGDLDDADRAFAALEVGAMAAGDPATVGRALSLRGMVAQQRGQLGLAGERYADAARRLGGVGELHAAAVAELNLGTVLAERGRASEALPRLAAAARVFAELGATTELCAAELNRGNALLAVGQREDALAAAQAALARSTGAPHLRAFALLVEGDAHLRLADPPAAERSYREALTLAVARHDAHAQLSAHIALAEAGHRSGEPEAIEATCSSADDRDRWTLAHARLELAGAAPDTARVLAGGCAAVADRADRADRLERAFRGHLLASQLAARGRDPALAQVEADRARTAHAAMVAAAAPAFRAAIEAEADAELGQLADAAPDQRDDGPGPGPLPLRRLLTLSRRLNTEASVARILDDVIDTAIELSAAERGFLLLRQGSGELAAVVSRNFQTGDLEPGSAVVSRSIAERAAQTGEPVVTVDAGVDERFGAAASVAALQLRSVLAVPLRQRGAIIGCIYVDHRLRGGAFDEAAASVLGELADIAAIAIENARLGDDLRRTTRALDDLNGRLSSELAERDAELVRVKADLPDRDRLRHRYERIVGRSAAMVRTLGIVDRAAATSLPIVIVGESGTGKELVARALHDHGPRATGPFVAINCSALPEPLLESELFGHVRGSFTGADRDRRGLFEVADGGTLFLDEVADTSPGMQAKLLRVLQDGLVRRVGDSGTRKVDVRVIAASQLSLAELSAQGRFREDLRFRLEVITVPMPALRERDGDIPILVEHLLAALCNGRPPPRLTRAALRALAQHRWPGNVRELENALARGLAMGGDVIDLEDLPDAIALASSTPSPTKPTVGDDLHLKPALAITEQAYITAAMGRAKGNQTVAARLLGLSRFGLQKKLRRLSGDAADED